MVIKRFEDMEAWQLARRLAVYVYELTDQGKFRRDWSLKDQMRRAAISIMANIAEGFDRGSNKEFIHFLTYALASASEVKSHLYLACDLKYLEEAQFNECQEMTTSVSRQIQGFIKYLKNTPKPIK